jgi:hypothetical protein
MSTAIRRSARLAKSCSTFGSVYVQKASPKPKVKKPKAQLRPRPMLPITENPVKFYIDGFNTCLVDEWAKQRVVWEPMEGERYDSVTVDIYFEEHDGECENPRGWFTEPELTTTIHLQCIGEMPFGALYRPWTEENHKHKGCDAKIHYIVRKVELSKPFVWKGNSSSFCKACGSGVDFMEFCPCQQEHQDQCEDDGGYPDSESDYGSYEQDEEEAPAPCTESPDHYKCGCPEMHRLNYEWSLKFGQ